MNGENFRKMVGAREAAERLQVTLPTLYAYVSRGLIHSETSPGNARERMYSLADIEQLVWRKTKARKPTSAAATALSWGLPVLETQLSTIQGGLLTYHGHDIAGLAESCTLEDVAALLWRTSYDPFNGPPFNADRIEGWDSIARLVPLEEGIDRAIALMSLVRRCQPETGQGPGVSGWFIKALASAFIAGRLDPDRPLHEGIALAWDRPEAADLVRRILVCCADHELNASTFAVRVAASIDVDFGTCLLTGLTTICGVEHTGAIKTTRLMLGEVFVSDDFDGIIQKWSLPDGRLSGFYHRLYPDGDPRTNAILFGLRLPDRLMHFLDEVLQKTGLRPNVELALVAGEYIWNLPTGASEALFAIGRAVGWIAHATEQRSSGVRIRPRAITKRPATGWVAGSAGYDWN